MTGGNATYPPLHTLKPVAGNVWIVDGPLIEFGPRWFKMPFPTRMTVVRLGDGGLFLHSPVSLTPALAEAVRALGTVRWLIGPNRIHYWWLPEWRGAFPEAEVHLAARIAEQARGRIAFPAHPLDAETGYPWDAEIATQPIAGRYMTEVEFFHRASRTLILTDLIENFEPDKLKGPFARLVARLGGALDPHGGMPRDMRLTYDRRTLRAAIERMIGWAPERVIVAHGRWYDRDGAAELARAFAWLLD